MKKTRIWALCALLVLPVAAEAKTTVIYLPDWPSKGPFPSDLLTVAARSQKTGRQVNLSSASFACLGSDYLSCDDVTASLNELDGFSVKPQFNICFSGPIDPDTLSNGMFVAPANGNGPAMAINQVFYDDSIHCAMAKPDNVLNQSTRYLLVISDRVRDLAGQPVAAEDTFKSCAQGIGSAYCGALSKALTRLLEARAVWCCWRIALHDDERDRLAAEGEEIPVYGAVRPAILPAGTKNVFDVADLLVFDWLPQTNIAMEPPVEAIPIPTFALEGVEKVAFGLYLSPNFLRLLWPATVDD